MNATKASPFAVPTTPDGKARIAAVVHTDAFIGRLQNLYARWLDESQYEDINDYATVIKTLLPSDFEMVKMTKRPFGFHFKIGTDAVYSFDCNLRGASWKRIS